MDKTTKKIMELEQQKTKLYNEIAKLELISFTIDEQIKLLRKIEIIDNEIICLSIFGEC